MFYLFDKDGNTATFCPDYEHLFDMFATVEKEVTETGADGAKVTKTVKCLPEGYSIKEYDGYIEPGILYLDAAMSGNTDAMDAIKQELAALNEKYDADYAELNK